MSRRQAELDVGAAFVASCYGYVAAAIALVALLSRCS